MNKMWHLYFVILWLSGDRDSTVKSPWPIFGSFEPPHKMAPVEVTEIVPFSTLRDENVDSKIFI